MDMKFWGTIIVVLLVGFVLGARNPQYAAKFGLA